MRGGLRRAGFNTPNSMSWQKIYVTLVGPRKHSLIKTNERKHRNEMNKEKKKGKALNEKYGKEQKKEKNFEKKKERKQERKKSV